jgi:hypothetical protein
VDEIDLRNSAYLNETQKFGINEKIVMNYQPHPWDYDPYSFRVTCNNKMKLASRNVSALVKMADAQYRNKTISVTMSNQAYNYYAASQGVPVVSQLCPSLGCPVPPPPSIDNPMLWSKKASWYARCYRQSCYTR